MNLYLKLDEDLQQYLWYIYVENDYCNKFDARYSLLREYDDVLWISMEIYKEDNNQDGWFIETSYIGVEDGAYEDYEKCKALEQLHSKALQMYDDEKLYSDEEVNRIAREIMNLL